MIEALAPILILLGAVAIWHNALGSREQARQHAARLCHQARLQLLDQSVSLKRFRVRHVARQGWQIQREYMVDVSSTGHDRRPGPLRMAGGRLVAWRLLAGPT